MSAEAILYVRVRFDPEDRARFEREVEWLERTYPVGQPHLAAERERQIARIASNWGECAIIEPRRWRKSP